MALVVTDTRSETVIRLENAGKVYAMGNQQVAALDGIDVAFEKGGFWAVMGSSGSGKSTLMNVIGCLDRLTSGRYLFQGTDISAYDDDALSDIRLRYLGFIFQSFNLIPQLTVQR
ncbi:MAG: ATP-binding cassette domain-containing protein, partial [Desulfotignum sp.]